MKRLGFRRNATFVVVRLGHKTLKFGEELNTSHYSRSRLRRWYTQRVLGTKGDAWTDMKLELGKMKMEEEKPPVIKEIPKKVKKSAATVS